MRASRTQPDLVQLRAVSYVHVSTTHQSSGGATEEGFSIPAQREANRRRVHELSALIVAEFIERGRSDRSLERPDPSRMLDYLDSTRVDFVIVHRIDRLARNRGGDATISDRVRAAGARLVSTTEAINTSPSGQLLHGIMASIAEFCSQNLAIQVMKGLRQKALQGGTPDRAPLGYLNERQLVEGRETRYVALDPARTEHITWAFEAHAWGKWSLNEIAAELGPRGMTTKPRPDIPEKPLIDPVAWADVQDILTARHNGERARAHDHYCKGSVFCIACGRRLIVRRNRSIYKHFGCTKRLSCVCPYRKSLPMTWCEEQVISAYRFRR